VSSDPGFDFEVSNREIKELPGGVVPTGQWEAWLFLPRGSDSTA